MPWTSDDLVAAVRRRAQLPDSTADGAIEDVDILQLADEEIALRLVPLVRRAREDYFTASTDVSVTSGTASYRLPARAQGAGLRDVTIIGPDGNEWSVPRIRLEDVGEYEQTGRSFAFVLEGNDIRLVPSPTTNDYTLRLRYHRAHPQLIPVSGAGGVFNVDATSFDVADTTALIYDARTQDTIAPFSGIVFDLAYSGPPFGYLSADVTSTGVTSGGGFYTVTYGASEPSTANPDSALYMTWPGLSPVVSLPREVWPLLVSAVVARVLEVLGDRDAAQLAFGLYAREESNVIELLTPRVEGERIPIIDRHSTLRSRRW